MKKRLTALILALALVFALGAPAVSADGDEPAEAAVEVAEEGAAPEEAEAAGASEGEQEEEPAPAPDASGTLSFANLGGRMKESYYPMHAIQEGIDDIESHDYDWRKENLRIRINELADAQWGLTLLNQTSAAQALQSSYDAFRDQLDDIKDGKTQKDDENALWQYRNAQNLAVIGGETIYIQVKNLQAQDEAASRGLARLDRTLRELELRRELGQVSALDVDQVKSARTQLASQQQTLRAGIDALLLTLESMVGAELGEPLTLGELPKVTGAQLAAMDLEKDLVRAMERSYALFDARQQIDDFRKEGAYHEVTGIFGTDEKVFEVSQVTHALKAMQYDYENTELTYELNFRVLYAQVKDAAQVLDAKKAALASQERSYAVSALKYEQGSISANALSEAKEDLASAKADVSTAERDLFSQYHTYQWAVEYGILNG